MAYAPAAAKSTIDAADVANFAAHAQHWWDANGPFAPLHRMNPTRLAYIRTQVLAHRGLDAATADPLQGLHVLDVGCGGGLLCEPLARLGGAITGIDAAERSIEVARHHAVQGGLTIDYQATTAEALAASAQRYDLVLALEIVEHVADLELFYDALTTLVAPGGLLVLSTLNRTAKSFLMGIVAAEYILRWVPRGTHHWQQFILPSEMAKALTQRHFTITDTTGISFDPRRGSFTLTPQDLGVNYLLTATKNS